jgi:hypothetical protein
MAVRYEKSAGSNNYILSWDEASPNCQFQTPDGQIIDLDSDGVGFLIKTLPLIRFSGRSARRGAANLRPGLRNVGAPWTNELDQKLRHEWNQAGSIEKIAKEFERTDGAIRSRLIKLGVIRDDENKI